LLEHENITQQIQLYVTFDFNTQHSLPDTGVIPYNSIPRADLTPAKWPIPICLNKAEDEATINRYSNQLAQLSGYPSWR